MLKLGSTDINKSYLGATEINKIYLGADEVFSGGVVPFDPSTLPLNFWHDASDLSTIVDTAGAVSQWRDKGPNGYHWGQSTGAAQPFTGTRTINGLNVIESDGTSYMGHATNAMRNMWSDADGYTILIVFALDSASSASTILSLAMGASNRGLIKSSNSATMQYNSSSSSNYFDIARTADTDAHIAGMVRDGNSVTALYDDLTNTGTASDISSSLGNMRIFSLSVSAGDIMDGVIAEILCWKGSDETDLENATTYLKNKWGTP